jgi:hypothetical protein
MIRIDEIYNHTFWPYIQQYLPLTRLFVCDPFGHTNPENLINFGNDTFEKNFVYCHDQEPVYVDVHKTLFDDVVRRNKDLNHGQGADHSAIIVSESQSDSLTQVCSQYNWKPYYYFFHGWAALDWYRGYHRSFLISDPQSRSPNQVYFNANRIISGKRKHRVLMMYHLGKSNCLDGYFSLPKVCVDSRDHIKDIAAEFVHHYPDIFDVLDRLPLPAHLPNESDHPMHSCWLSQFDAVSDSLVYVVTETVAQGRRLHLTEKTFRPICMQIPFLLVSTQGSLQYLKSYGFKTFHEFWDESYDQEPDDLVRIESIAKIIRDLHRLSRDQKRKLYQSMIPVIQHNFNHFYGGEFERILWNELTGMLSNLRNDFNA